MFMINFPSISDIFWGAQENDNRKSKSTQFSQTWQYINSYWLLDQLSPRDSNVRKRKERKTNNVWRWKKKKAMTEIIFYKKHHGTQ